MKVALDIDRTPILLENRLSYATILPVLNASKRKADIIFFTESIEAAAELIKLLPFLNLVPGKTAVYFGRPSADLYLGVGYEH